MAITIAYDKEVKGWTSQYSFIPDSGVSLNNDFYTFKNGRIWVHNALDTNRNTFYDLFAPTEMVFIFNEAPSNIKNFKTINFEGNGQWTVGLATDLDEVGTIEPAWFKTKEGKHFAWIRGQAKFGTPDLQSSTVGGIGVIESLPSTGIWDPLTEYAAGDIASFQVTLADPVISYRRLIAGTTTDNPSVDITNWKQGITYIFQSIPSGVSIGDPVYFSEITGGTGNTPNIAGIVDAIDSTSVTLTHDGIPQDLQPIGSPVSGDFLFYAKDAQVETSGIIGFYNVVTMTNNEATAAELFAVSSDVHAHKT